MKWEEMDRCISMAEARLGATLDEYSWKQLRLVFAHELPKTGGKVAEIKMVSVEAGQSQKTNK